MANSNNWFSFSLPTEVRTNLHEIALQIQSSPQEVFADASTEFRPMSLGEMHMTLCYFGERMQHLKRDSMRYFHEELTREIKRVASSGPIPIQFREYALFPPGKNNLIVALFDVSEPLLAVVHAVLDLCCRNRLCDKSDYYATNATTTSTSTNNASNFSANSAGSSHEQLLFQAHVTMGKLSGLKALRRMQIPAPQAAASFLCNGIYLCGKKIGGGLDWTIAFDSSGASLSEANSANVNTSADRGDFYAKSEHSKSVKVKSKKPCEFTCAQVKREIAGNARLIADINVYLFGQESATSSACSFKVGQVQSIRNGWMNSAFIVELLLDDSFAKTGSSSRKKIFLKLNASEFAFEMFASEATGLKKLRETQLFRVPHVISVGEFAIIGTPADSANDEEDDWTPNTRSKSKNKAKQSNNNRSEALKRPKSFTGAYLVMECLDLLPENKLTEQHFEKFAKQLARLHVTQSIDGTCGFVADTYLNAFRQPNNCNDNASARETNNNDNTSNSNDNTDWAYFFTEFRMRPATENLKRTLSLSNEKKNESHVSLLLQKLPRLRVILACIPAILQLSSSILSTVSKTEMKPVLLHGDLSNNWGAIRGVGNESVDDIEIALFDCCPFYGHSEFEFASFSLALDHSFFGHYLRYCSEFNKQRPEEVQQQSKDENESKFCVSMDEKWMIRHRLYQLYHNLALLSVMTNTYFTNLCFENLKKLGIIDVTGSIRDPNSVSPSAPLNNNTNQSSAGLDLSKLKPLYSSEATTTSSTPIEEKINVVLVNQGSFAPIHNNHLSTMETTKRILEEKYNCHVLGGYFAPSADTFLRKKLAGASFSLVDRCHVIDRAVEKSDWLMTARDGFKTAQLLSHISSSIESAKGWKMNSNQSQTRSGELNPKSGQFEIVVVCGIDSLPEVIARIPKDMKLAVVRRPNYDADEMKLKQTLNSGNGEGGSKVDETSYLTNLKRIIQISEWVGPDISSTAIRRLMQQQDYEKLKEMMNDSSVDYLRQNAAELHRQLFSL